MSSNFLINTTNYSNGTNNNNNNSNFIIKKNSLISNDNSNSSLSTTNSNSESPKNQKVANTKNSNNKKVTLSGPNVNLNKNSVKNTNKTNTHNQNIKQKIMNKAKTELCKNWELYNDCFYKNTCSFAHGKHELKACEFKNYYDIRFCVVFFTQGICMYGKRCKYLHKIQQVYNRFSYSYLLNKQLELTHLTNNNNVKYMDFLEKKRLSVFSKFS